MGAGSGYWAKLLQLRGVDIVCYDLHVAGEEENEEEDGDVDGEDDDDDKEEQDEDEDEEEEAEEEGENGDEDGDEDEEEEEEMVEVEQIFWTEVLKGTPKVNTGVSVWQAINTSVVLTRMDGGRICASTRTGRCSCATRTTLRTRRIRWRSKAFTTTQATRSSTSARCSARLSACPAHGTPLVFVLFTVCAQLRMTD